MHLSDNVGVQWRFIPFFNSYWASRDIVCISCLYTCSFISFFPFVCLHALSHTWWCSRTNTDSMLSTSSGDAWGYYVVPWIKPNITHVKHILSLLSFCSSPSSLVFNPNSECSLPPIESTFAKYIWTSWSLYKLCI